MENSGPTTSKNRIYAWLAAVFLILFATFWSLDTFFFWTFLLFGLYFGFLYFYSSGTFNRPPDSLGKNDQSRSTTSSSNTTAVPQKVIRIVIITVASIFMFLFVVGLFSSNDDDSDPVATEDDNSTTSIESEDPSFVTQGNAAFDRKHYDSAMTYYEQALEKNPKDQYGLYNKSLVFYMKQDYRSSVKWARSCLRYYSDYNSAWWLLGDDYSNLSNYDSAIYCLEKAYNNDFRDSDFLQLMAEVYLKKNNRTKATEFYKKVVELDTTNVESLKQLLQLDPDNADWYRKKVSELESN